jgi:hypothetical protein
LGIREGHLWLWNLVDRLHKTHGLDKCEGDGRGRNGHKLWDQRCVDAKNGFVADAIKELHMGGSPHTIATRQR